MPPSGNEINQDGKDIISSLPDTILLEILSFLDMKHAVQTTILSKRWTDLWASLRKLTFDTQLFYSPTKAKFIGFHNFVDQVLILRHNSDIDTFDITNTTIECNINTRRLKTWIVSVIRSKVQQLNIRNSHVIQLPKCLYTCNSLKKLTLAINSDGRWSIPLPDSMCLPNLRELQLYSVLFQDENLTNKFFLSCPNLEELVIKDVEFREMNVKISYLKLMGLEVDTILYRDLPDTKFKLHAPGLLYFSCLDYMSKDYILDNLSSLVKADYDMKVEEEDQNPGSYAKLPAKRKQMYANRMMQCLGALCSVEDLKLSAWFLEVLSGSPDLFEVEPTKLCYLTCLRLETWLSVHTIRAIAYLFKISPNIKYFFLDIRQMKFGSENIGDNLEAEISLQCVLEKLEIVKIQGAVGCSNELNFLQVLLKNAKVLKKLVVCTTTEHSPDRRQRFMRFTEKLLMFPRASSNITVLFF